MERRCPECNNPILDNETTCYKCGGKLPKELETSKPRKSKILGILSLIMGSIGLILSFIYIGIVPALAGYILSLIAFTKKNSAKKLALIGLILSVVGTACFIGTVIVDYNNNSSEDNSKPTISATDEKETTIEKETEGEPITTEPVTEPATQSPTETINPSTAEPQTQPQTEAPTPAPTEPPTQKPTEKPTPAPTEAPTEKPVTVSDIQILEEYTYSDGFWYTYHFVVVKNNSNKPVTISTSTLAYKSDGTLISVDEGYVDIVGSGCTTIYYEAFETTEEISYYDTEMTVDTDVWYECGLNGLSYAQTNIQDGAIFQVTNNGNKAVDFVEGYALFIKDGKVVSWESNYFTDDDSEIKVGKTISKQFSAYKEFDTVKFYLTGRISEW